MRLLIAGSIALFVMLGSTYRLCVAPVRRLISPDTVDRDIPAAPMQTDVSNSLAPTRPTVTSIAPVSERKNTLLARKQLAQYFRTRISTNRESETRGVPRISPQIPEVVDVLTGGVLQGASDLSIHSFPEGEIDHRLKAPYHPSGWVPSDLWQRNRTGNSSWHDLTAAYRATGDERHAFKETNMSTLYYDDTPIKRLDPSGTFFVQAFKSTGGTADVWIKNCLAAAIAVGGMCDATALVGTWNFAANGNIVVGNSSGAQVALELPCSATWNFYLSGGTLDMVDQYPNTAIFSDCSQLQIDNTNMVQAAGVSGAANYGYRTLNPSSGYEAWYWTKGLSITQHGQGFASGIEALIDTGVDSSYWGYDNFFDSSTTDTAIMKIAGQPGSVLCCGATFDHIFSYGNDKGGVPLLLIGAKGGSPTAITIRGGTFGGQRSGLNTIECTDTNPRPTTTFAFTDTVYTETNLTDYATPPIIQIDGCAAVSVEALEIASKTVIPMTRQIVNISKSFNTSFHMGHLHIQQNATLPNTQAIANANGSTVPTDANGNLSGYDSLTRYVETLEATKIIDSTIVASASPICPNGPGGAFTTSGCSGSVPSLTGTTGSIGGIPVNASCVAGIASVRGAKTSMPVAASPSTPGAPGNFSVIASVTSADTVTVSVCGTGTPTASTYIVSVEAGFTTSHGSTSSTPDKKLASASLDASVTTEDSDKTIASEIVVPCCLVAPGNGSAPGATSGWTYVSGSFSIASGGPGGREIAFHRNGKFDNLSVCINTPQPSSGSLIITLQIGVWQGMLSSTSQKLIIPAGSTVGCYTAPGAAAVYTAGQAAVYYITNNASGSSAELGTIYQEFDNAH